MKLRLNDTVKVIAGKDKGQTGKIEKIIPKSNMVVVAGVNQYKKHLKQKDQNKPGGIIDITKPLNISKVALVCPQCKESSRIGFEGEKKKKIRICKKCQKPIDTATVTKKKK